MTNEHAVEREGRAWLDMAGIAASWLCVVHCLLLPFVVSALPLIGLRFLLDETVEQIVIGISVGVAAFTLVPGYLGSHHKIRALALYVSGLALILMSKTLFEDDHWLSILFIAGGAVLISAAHFLNIYLCRWCNGCRSADLEQ